MTVQAYSVVQAIPFDSLVVQKVLVHYKAGT